MATFTAATPSPPPTIHTPDTPRFGYGDSWEPYSPRKSARISSRRTTSSARTPSPKPAPANNPRPPRFHVTRASPTKGSTVKSSHSMSSPAPSPRKRQAPTKEAMSSNALSAESTRRAVDFLNPSPGGKHDTPTARGRTTVSAQAGMLPTPVKTPSRKHAEQNEANIAAIARNLFHSEDDEAMPNPKQKRVKKYSGISMNSFTAVEVEDPIHIFTDSQDRVPEVDTSAENPFYGDHVPPAADPVRRRSKRKTVVVPGEGTSTVDEAMHRDDGLVYVFRGKKIFRKFADKDDDDLNELDNGEGSSAGRGQRDMARSSMKPRLLFPPEPKSMQALDSEQEDDEEAVTDIEDHVQSNDQPEEEQQPATPAKMVGGKAPATPDAPRFAPYSPPGTGGRTTRSSQKLVADESTPMKQNQPVRKVTRSPFDDWRRTKRPGDSLQQGVDAKRSRN